MDSINKNAGDALSNQIMQDAPDGIIAVDHTGRVVIYNSAAERMFGYSTSDVVGKSVDILIPMNEIFEQAKSSQCITPADFSAGSPRPLITDTHRRSGEPLCCEVQVSQTKIAGKQYYMASVRDITNKVSKRKQIIDEIKKLSI